MICSQRDRWSYAEFVKMKLPISDSEPCKRRLLRLCTHPVLMGTFLDSGVGEEAMAYSSNAQDAYRPESKAKSLNTTMQEK